MRRNLIDNSRPQSPCKDCNPPERFLGCHSVCPDYQEFRNKSDLASMALHKKKSEMYEYDIHRKELFQKIKQRRKGI